MSPVETDCDACAGRIDEDELVDAAILIRNLRVGDMFHASARSASSFILIVTATTGGRILARRVTTQDDLVFDCGTGQVIEPQDARGNLWIDSVEPLPIHHHNALLELDRRYRLGRKITRLALTNAEKAALLFTTGFYAEHSFEDFAPERVEA